MDVGLIYKETSKQKAKRGVMHKIYHKLIDGEKTMFKDSIADLFLSKKKKKKKGLNTSSKSSK
jgi:hypothetical protein